MTTHKGKPSGKSKPMGTGIPAKVKATGMEQDKKITDQFTKEDVKLAEHVRQKHPNRNVNKKSATNAGRYRN